MAEWITNDSQHPIRIKHIQQSIIGHRFQASTVFHLHPILPLALCIHSFCVQKKSSCHQNRHICLGGRIYYGIQNNFSGSKVDCGATNYYIYVLLSNILHLGFDEY
jgi:hypothetical protein